MKNYRVYGWNDNHTFSFIIVPAHSIKEARLVALDFGLYPTEIHPIRIHPGRPSQLT